MQQETGQTIGVEDMAVRERAAGVKLCNRHVGGSTVAAAGNEKPDHWPYTLIGS